MKHKPKHLRASAAEWFLGSDDGRPVEKERLKVGDVLVWNYGYKSEAVKWGLIAW